MKELEFLKEQNVSEDLIHGVEEFRKNYGVDEAVQGRVTRPSIPFLSLIHISEPTRH